LAVEFPLEKLKKTKNQGVARQKSIFGLDFLIGFWFFLKNPTATHVEK